MNPIFLQKGFTPLQPDAPCLRAREESGIPKVKEMPLPLGRVVAGFTLIESLVGVAVFMIIAVSVYQAYAVTMNAVRVSRLKIIATALANEQFEIIRNLPYDDVGVVGSIPNGKIPRIQNFIRDNTEFAVETTIHNIDDPFEIGR